jgi:hypothetical protein
LDPELFLVGVHSQLERDIKQRTADLQPVIVVNEAQFPEAVHKADPERAVPITVSELWLEKPDSQPERTTLSPPT